MKPTISTTMAPTPAAESPRRSPVATAVAMAFALATAITLLVASRQQGYDGLGTIILVALPAAAVAAAAVAVGWARSERWLVLRALLSLPSVGLVVAVLAFCLKN
jgi:hypothetical protein